MRSLKGLNSSLIFALAASIVLNMGQAWYHDQTKQPLLDEISQLRTDIRLAAPVTTATPRPSSSPAKLTLVSGQSLVSVSFYDVQLVVQAPVADLVYGTVGKGQSAAAGFTTQSLLARYPDCKAGTLGTLVRVKASPTPTPKASATPSAVKTPSNQPFKKTVNGYAYSYQRPAFSCATDQAGRNQVAEARAAFETTVLPTLAAR